jgi:hypothetical protein
VTRRRDLRRLGLTGWTYRAAYDRLWELFASLDTMPTPEMEQEAEQPVFRRGRSEDAVTPLTGGHGTLVGGLGIGAAAGAGWTADGDFAGSVDGATGMVAASASLGRR